MSGKRIVIRPSAVLAGAAAGAVMLVLANYVLAAFPQLHSLADLPIGTLVTLAACIGVSFAAGLLIAHAFSLLLDDAIARS